MFRMRSMAFSLLALVCLAGTFARGQAYTSIVILGDSLSDTGNDATVSYAKYGPTAQVPAPVTGYTLGRFTDGTDTLPAAKAYYGVWIEQLAAMLAAKPTVNYSLNTATPGGTNYAYGFATTNTGQSTFTYPAPNQALNFNVNNMGTQLSTYLGTNPTITNKTLFVVWGGANDLIAASTSANPTAAIQAAAQNEAGIVQALINAGATDFIVPNLPPLGLVPRFNGSTATSVPATQQLAAGFDQYLAAYLAAIPAANPGKTLHLYQLDTYTLFSTIVASPSARGFTNVTASSSAAYTGITTTNPDTYLFWDDLHPTTYGHYQLALSALTLIGTPLTTTTTLATSNSQPNPGQNFTLTATVTDTAGTTTPMGLVTFLDGGTAIGTAYVTGSNATGTATLTTSYATASKHTITASFSGVNGYSSSSSPSAGTAITVTPPILTPTLSPTSLTITAGTYGLDTVTLTPMGGYSGTATVACGSLPAHFTCTVATPTVTLPGTNAVVTDNVTIGTIASASLARPALGGRSEQELVLACGLLPGLGLLSFAAIRRKRITLRRIVLPAVLVLLAGAGTLSLSGCSNAQPTYASPVAKPGSYTVPIIVTATGTGGGTTTLNLAVTVQ